jgi:glycosyltransferase involved in cell wall biosynthesis
LERQLCYLLQTMDRERYRPAVVVWSFHEEDAYVPQIRALGVPLYSFPGAASGAAKLGAFRRLVRQLKPQVVHSYSFYTNFAAWWATLGLQTIPLGSIRQDFICERQTAGQVLGRLSARWPRAQLCNSLAARRTVAQSVGPFKPTQLYLARNGLDIDRFKPQPVPRKGSSVLAIGRLSPEKRWDRLLRSVAVLAARRVEVSVRLAGEGSLRGELQAQARQLGVQEMVQFMGIRHDIPALLKDSLFLVHTADAEGCPNVVMEAMACKRAVVATDAGDVPSLVADGTTGFVVPRGDDATLVERIVTLLNDRELCRAMGEAGRAKAEREFGLDRLVTETLAAYGAAGWKES